MTVGELIAALRDYPDDTLVYVEADAGLGQISRLYRAPSDETSVVIAVAMSGIFANDDEA